MNLKMALTCVTDGVFNWETRFVKIDNCKYDIFTMYFLTGVQISGQSLMYTF